VGRRRRAVALRQPARLADAFPRSHPRVSHRPDHVSTDTLDRGSASTGHRTRGLRRSPARLSLPTDPLERVVDRSDVDAHLDDASPYDDRRPGRAGRAARAPTTRRRPGAAVRRGRSPSSPARGTDRRFCHRAVAQLCPALRTDGSCSRTELSTMRRSEETREDTTLNDALSWATASSAASTPAGSQP
jgi:hypothetical protein